MAEFYKIRDVCKETDTQPYVLRFWESEFPQLSPRQHPSGQSVYTASDVDLIRRIKQLLYEEEYTIAGARKLLEKEVGRRSGSRPRKQAGATRGSKSVMPVETNAAARPVEPRRIEEPALFPVGTNTVERERYDNAVQEIQRLRRDEAQLTEELDEQAAKAVTLERTCEEQRERAREIADRLERLIVSIDGGRGELDGSGAGS